ncbi:class I SAM-dependent methyltransferase [Spirillospora sp. NPDC127200]
MSHANALVRRSRRPLFARFYARAAPAMEQAGISAYRQELLARASGRVLEAGAGSGTNFPHYPPGVTEVVAVEPEPHLRRLACRTAQACPVPITVTEGVVERLAEPDHSFDAAVACLVLCSVRDPDAALAEMFRVLRPGGRLHVFEHVRARTQRLRRVQGALDATVWPLLNGGCHLTADTGAAIERAGFTYEQVRQVNWPNTRPPMPISPHLLGTAVRP